MSFNPKVSIIIPVYNGSNYLNAAINSALAQTYNNIEVVVVNDGSNDGGKTEAIAKSFGDRIRYFYKENGGVATALNLAVQKSEGEYISWLSHDDIYFPVKIQTQIDYLKLSHKRDVVIYSDWEHIDKNYVSLGFDRKVPAKHSIYAVMNCLINGCTLLIPRICFNEVGFFDDRLQTTQDYDLWFKMSRKFEFIHIPEILVKYRIHPEQDSLKHPEHLKEENVLHTNFNKELSIDEILSLEKSLPLFYIKRANFYKNKFIEAENYTYEMFKKNCFKVKDNTLGFPLIMYYLMLYKFCKS